uniref:mesoderm-specific transcript homolog protein isoform X2 n=1 Tax=Myxine glutinosa TaxID=7769 RepID=UPI00358E3DD8
MQMSSKGRFLFALFLLPLLAVYVNLPAPPLTPMLLQWQDSGSFFIFEQHSIFYKDVRGYPGNGDALILLHGFPTSSYDWSKVWDVLSQRYTRVILLDFLGFGFSAKPAHKYSIVEQADIVQNLCDDLEIVGKKVHIISHDYGVSVAQELLARYESRAEGHLNIKSICFSNGGLFPETNHPRLLQKLLKDGSLLSPILTRLSNYFLFKSGLREVFGVHTQPSRERFWDMWVALRRNDGHLALASLLGYIEERWENRRRWIGVLNETRVPLHLIYGPADPVNPHPSFVQRFKSVVSESAVTVLPAHISHYPHLEDPRGFLHAYFTFVNSF